MFFSRPTLHPPLISTDQHRDLVRSRIAALTAGQPKGAGGPIAGLAPFSIPLTTVSMLGNFDSFIDVHFANQGPKPFTATLLVDSGNTCMVIPNAEDLYGASGYQILGKGTEPWGCPALIMQGPVQIAATDGGTYQIDNCVFYACTAENSDGERTSNFGMGRITPWSTDSSNTRHPIVQSPLSYGTDYLYAEVIFEPAATMLSTTADVLVSRRSRLVMHATAPSGYTLLSIIPNLAWMSVVPTSFAIGGTTTGWPGNVSPLIAMIDTGGGPVLLSDPNGYLWPRTWPNRATCPSWTDTSVNCKCIKDALQIGLAATSGGETYVYTIDTSSLPAEKGLTAVMCQVSPYLEGQQGMNVGGISFLSNRLLIDYAGAQVGLAPNIPP